MSDRDKISEIIREARINASPMSQLGYPEADALLDYGVIVPPCKVGNEVYVIQDKDIISSTITTDLNWTIIGDKIGKTVFLTREEAEKKLEEMRGNVAKG